MNGEPDLRSLQQRLLAPDTRWPWLPNGEPDPRVQQPLVGERDAGGHLTITPSQPIRVPDWELAPRE